MRLFQLTIILWCVFLFTGCTPQIKDLTISLAQKVDKLYEKDILEDDTSLEYKEGEMYLRVNKKWHSGLVNKIILTDDKKRMISISRSKEILITNLKTGKLEEKILGEIGQSDFGKIDAIALTPNDRYLAIGGRFGYKTDTVDTKADITDKMRYNSGAIRLYDLKQKKQTKLLLSSPSFIEHLEISPDGKYLVSASKNGELKVWDLKQYNVPFGTTIKNVSSMAITKKNRLYVGTLEGQIIPFDLMLGERLPSRFFDSSVNAIALGKNEIAIGLSGINNAVTIVDEKLDTVDTIHFNRGVDALDYSPKSRYLMVGVKPLRKPDVKFDGVKIFDRQNKNRMVRHYTRNDDSIKAVKFIDKSTVLSAGGTDSTPVYVWNFKTNKTIRTIKGYQRYLSLAIKGDKIAFGDEQYKDFYKRKNRTNNRGPLKKSFDLDKMQITDDIEGFERLLRVEKNRKLEAERFGTGYTQIAYYKDGDKVSTIPLGNFNIGSAVGFHHNYIMTGGIFPKVYNEEFEEVAQLKGHVGKVWAMKGYKHFIVTAGSDRMINFWDTRELNQKKFKVLSPAWKLFIDNNYEWVLWNKDGYFNASENGHHLIGFHLNKGFKHSAQWIGIEKLYDHFYRPDLVKLALQGKDIKPFTNGLSYKDVLKNPPPTVKIVKANKKLLKSKKIDHYKRSIDLEFDVNAIDNGGVGIVRIYQEGKLVQTIGKGKVNKTLANAVEDIKTEELTQKAKQDQEEYLAQLEKSVTKSINGTVGIDELVKPVHISNSVSNQQGMYKITLPLKAGKNSIAIEAFNKTNTVASVKDTITINAKIKKRKPVVYAIVAGVNKFQSTKRLKDLKYSENDAQAIKNAIQSRLKEKVVVKYLTGKNLTKANLNRAIKEIKAKAKLEDKVIFYISTHGKAIRGDLYLVPHNNKSARNWINFEHLFKDIQSINALEQIFVIDACESGGAIDVVSSIYDSKASVLAKQSGVHVLLATAKDTFAFEHPNPKIKHGVFTNNILTALNDRTTDKNRDKKISVIELSKALKAPKYTVKHQYPVIRNVGQDMNVRDLK